MNIDTSILALVTLRVLTNAVTDTATEGVSEVPKGTERWSATLHGLKLVVLFQNSRDRWTIAASDWTTTFRFYPSAPLAESPSEQHPDWFGSWGKLTEGLVTGDADAFLRDLTLLRVALEAFQAPHHTFVEFLEARVGP